jgi:hypothetical protein
VCIPGASGSFRAIAPGISRSSSASAAAVSASPRSVSNHWHRRRARIACAAILGLLQLAQTDPETPESAVLAGEAIAIFLGD